MNRSLFLTFLEDGTQRPICIFLGHRLLIVSSHMVEGAWKLCAVSFIFLPLIFWAELRIMWELSSFNRNLTQALCMGNAKSWPLDHQGSLSGVPFQKGINLILKGSAFMT